MKGSILKRYSIVLWFISAALIFGSCASQPLLLGKWREVGKTASLEFFADGAFKAADNQGMAVSGRYTLSKDGKLRCEIQQDGILREVVNLTASIQGDELTLRSPGSSGVEIYIREK